MPDRIIGGDFHFGRPGAIVKLRRKLAVQGPAARNSTAILTRALLFPRDILARELMQDLTQQGEKSSHPFSRYCQLEAGAGSSGRCRSRLGIEPRTHRLRVRAFPVRWCSLRSSPLISGASSSCRIHIVRHCPTASVSVSVSGARAVSPTLPTVFTLFYSRLGPGYALTDGSGLQPSTHRALTPLPEGCAPYLGNPWYERAHHA